MTYLLTSGTAVLAVSLFVVLLHYRNQRKRAKMEGITAATMNIPSVSAITGEIMPPGADSFGVDGHGHDGCEIPNPGDASYPV